MYEKVYKILYSTLNTISVLQNLRIYFYFIIQTDLYPYRCHLTLSVEDHVISVHVCVTTALPVRLTNYD